MMRTLALILASVDLGFCSSFLAFRRLVAYLLLKFLSQKDDFLCKLYALLIIIIIVFSKLMP